MAEPLYSKTISEDALDALYIIEGHFRGAEQPTKNDGTKDKWTTYYGITEDGLSNVRKLRSKGIAVPDYLMKATVHTLNKQQAREAAGFNMMYLERELDSVYKDEDFKFSDLPIHIKSGALTVVYNGGLASYKKGYETGTATTSILQAAKTGSRENMALALLSGKDGALMNSPAISSNRGRANRVLSGVKMMYDTDNKSFANVAKRDETYARWQKDPTLVTTVANHVRNIEAGNRVRQKEMDNMQKGAVAFEQEMFAQLPKNQSKLTNTSENLFTNSEENTNVAQGNPDINLQQGPSPLGGGADQQLG